jgi:hypothetical protein
VTRWPARSVAVAVPGVGGSLLATLACPLCWPLYADLLGALGVGGVTYAALGLPLGVGFLIVSLASLGYRGRQRRGYRPFMLGITGAALLLAGEFAVASEVVTFSGVGLLIVAAVWNAWPCGACVNGNNWNLRRALWRNER